MKFLLVLAAIIAFASAEGPLNIQNNNVGDIVNVGVGLNAVVSSNVEVNILTVLMALLNQQLVGIGGGEAPTPFENQEQVAVAQHQLPALPDYKNLLSELISKSKQVKITPEMIEKAKEFLQNARNPQQ